MCKAFVYNDLDAISRERVTLLPGSARVLWWNPQENAREGGSWIGIENMSENQHHQTVTVLTPRQHAE